MNTDRKTVVEKAAGWIDAGARVALATVVQTWRSAPQPVGSQMAIDDAGRFVGSVSGGCVEGAVIEASVEVLGSGQAQLLSFGVANERAWEVGLPCGGEIQVLLSVADPALTERVARANGARRTLAVVTDMTSGAATVIDPADVSGLDDATREAVENVFASGASRVFTVGDNRTFVQLHRPAARLIIVGAVHLAQALAAIASAAELDVTVIDPRALFATKERFPNLDVITAWPAEAFAELQLDRRTAVAALSHDPKVDLPALRGALDSDCFYVGALGSRRRQTELRDRLRETGTTDAQLERICGPIGLDIGARTAPEIAVAIVAQIIESLRRQEPV